MHSHKHHECTHTHIQHTHTHTHTYNTHTHTHIQHTHTRIHTHTHTHTHAHAHTHTHSHTHTEEEWGYWPPTSLSCVSTSPGRVMSCTITTLAGWEMFLGEGRTRIVLSSYPALYPGSRLESRRVQTVCFRGPKVGSMYMRIELRVKH